MISLSQPAKRIHIKNKPNVKMNVFFITVIFLFDIEVFVITYSFINIYNNIEALLS